MIEGAFAIAESSLITPEDLPPYLIKQGSQPITYQEHLEAFERELLQKTLASCTTKTQAAEKLGMTKQALNYKLTSLGLK